MDVGPCLRDRSASKPHQILIVLNGKLYGITKKCPPHKGEHALCNSL